MHVILGRLSPIFALILAACCFFPCLVVADQAVTFDQGTDPIVIVSGILTVCPSGCDYSVIQDAINDASDGDTIQVQSGTYPEAVVVNR